MASMKPIKPSYSYDSSKSSYATNSYDRNFNQSGHNYQAQNSSLGRHMHNFHDDMYNQTWATKPTKYYAQGQCAQPSEAIHVVQGNHAVETIKKQESLKSENWTTDPPSSELIVSKEETVVEKVDQTVVEKVDQGCANNLNQYVDTTQADQLGFGMLKEEHMVEKSEQGWANKPTQYSGPSVLNKCDDEQSWANKPTQYSNAAQSNQYGGSMDGKKLMMAKAEQGWGNKPTQYSSAAQSNQYGGAMRGEELMMANKPSQYAGSAQSNHYERSEGHIIGKSGQDGLTKPTQYLEGTQSNQYAMHDNGHMMGNQEQGWLTKPNHYIDITQGNEHGLMVHKEEDSANNVYANASRTQVNTGPQSMYDEQGGGAISGRVTKASNYYGPNTIDHSLQLDYNQNKSQGWSAKPNKTLSPVLTSDTSLGKYNEGYGMGGSGQDLAHFTSHTGLGKYNEVQHDWAESPTRFSRPVKPNYSGLGMYKDEHKTGNMDHTAVDSFGQFSSPNRRNQYGQSMYNEHGSEAYEYNSDNNVHGGWANQQGKYFGQNQPGAYSGHNMYNEDAWAGKAGHGYSTAQTNHLANGAYNYADHEDCDENVHDIMDEILTKYPAHNVSGGHANGWEAKSSMYMNQNRVGGYAKQPSYAAPALYGNSGYMANVKEEYSSHSSSSSSKKFGVKGMSRNGGLFDDEC